MGSLIHVAPPGSPNLHCKAEWFQPGFIPFYIYFLFAVPASNQKLPCSIVLSLCTWTNPVAFRGAGWLGCWAWSRACRDGFCVWNSPLKSVSDHCTWPKKCEWVQCSYPQLWSLPSIPSRHKLVPVSNRSGVQENGVRVKFARYVGSRCPKKDGFHTGFPNTHIYLCICIYINILLEWLMKRDG